MTWGHADRGGDSSAAADLNPADYQWNSSSGRAQNLRRTDSTRSSWVQDLGFSRSLVSAASIRDIFQTSEPF